MTENLWDTLAGKFTINQNDENYSGASENVLFLWPAILKYLSDIENKTIIDFGCGAGTFCNHLFEKGANIYGVDASNDMLSAAKQTNAQIDFVGSLDDTPEEIDVVTSIHAFEFIEDIESTIKIISAKLISGGHFIFAVHDKQYLDDFAKHDGSYILLDDDNNLYDFGDVKIPIFARTVEHYTDLLTQFGFKNIEIQYPKYSDEFKIKNNINPNVTNWAVVIKAEK